MCDDDENVPGASCIRRTGIRLLNQEKSRWHQPVWIWIITIIMRATTHHVNQIAFIAQTMWRLCTRTDSIILNIFFFYFHHGIVCVLCPPRNVTQRAAAVYFSFSHSTCDPHLLFSISNQILNDDKHGNSLYSGKRTHTPIHQQVYAFDFLIIIFIFVVLHFLHLRRCCRHHRHHLLAVWCNVVTYCSRVK